MQGLKHDAYTDKSASNIAGDMSIRRSPRKKPSETEQNSAVDTKSVTLKKRTAPDIKEKATKKAVKLEISEIKKSPLKVAELVEESEMKATFERAMKTKRWVGAHVGASGGVHFAVANSLKIGGAAMALFLKSQRRWESPPLSEGVISEFKRLAELSGVDYRYILPHGSYLINLGNPDALKRQKAYVAFLDDLQRCEALGIQLYNFQ